MKKHLLFILLISTTISLMAIGTGDGSTEVSGCEEATQLYIDGNCWYFNSEGWYKFDLTELQNEEDIRVLLTNSFGIGGEAYSISFYESCDATEPLFALNGEMVDESSSVDTVIPKQALDGINELYFYTTYSEGISLNIYPYIPCSRFDIPYYEWGTVKVMDASLTEFENAFYFVDIEGFYATPQRFNIKDLSSNQSVKLIVKNPSISEGVFAFISFNNDCSSQGCFVGPPGSIFGHRIESGQTHSWILDFPYLFEGEQDAYFLPVITTGDGSFISGTWSLEIINAIKTSTCADAIDFQSDVLYEQLGNTNQYYTLNGALQDDITPLATEVTITNQSENEAEWICSVGYCGVEEIIAIEQLAAGETKTIQLEIPAFDTYYPEGGGNLYANITTTEDISMLFDVVDSDTTLPIEPCLNAIPISLGETVTAPANEESWYVLDITEVHEKQQEFRWTFTNLSNKEAEMDLGIYLDCEDYPDYAVVDFGKEFFYANSTYSKEFDYNDTESMFPDYISRLYIHVAPTEDMTIRFSLPAACEENAIELDWCNVHLSQLSTGWYKWNVADIHSNQEDVVFNVTNDMMYPTSVTMDYYITCEDTKPMNDFGGSQTYALGHNQQIMSYQRFVELFATGTDSFGEYYESGFHNNVYIHISSIVQDYEPEPTPETHLIRYTSTDGNIVTPYNVDAFGANVVSNTYEDGQGIITFDGPVTKIGENAFEDSENLMSIILHDSIVTIDDYAFANCSQLSTIKFGENLRSIGTEAFTGIAIDTLILPEGIDSISSNAFSSCANLKVVSIPTSLQYAPVGSGSESVFLDCSSIDSIYWNAHKCPNNVFHSSDPYSSSIRSIEFGDSIQFIPANFCEEFTELSTIVYPSTLRSIGESAFSGCTKLSSLLILDSIVTIDDYAFANCSQLSTIKFGENLRSIGTEAFTGIAIDTLILPEGIDSISSNAFSSCANLKVVSIPTSLQYAPVGSGSESVFLDCSSIDSIYWNAHKCPNNVFHSSDPYSSSIRSIEFGDSIQFIPANFCEDFTELSTIVYPSSLRSIGKSAFSGCAKLSSSLILDSIATIDDYAFANCSQLSTIKFGKNLRSIGIEAFTGVAIDTLILPEGIDSISSNAFSSCENLKVVSIPSSLRYAPWGSDNESVFAGCSSIDSIYWNAHKCPNNVFHSSDPYSSSIRSIEFGDSIQHIFSEFCMDFTALTNVILPISLQSISDAAFSGCDNLDTIYCHATTPPELYDEYVFSNYNATLYIPCEAVDVYKADAIWGKFSNIQCHISEPESSVTYNVTVPLGTYVCYIAGEMTDWAQQEMTKIDDTHYTVTMVNATTDMQYKYCSGPDWNFVECDAEGNDVVNRLYHENDVVAAWRAIYNPNGDNELMYNVTVPIGTKTCYIVGEMNAWTFQEMTKIDDTHYTISIAGATTDMQYKYYSGPDWDYVECDVNGEDILDRNYSINDKVSAWRMVYDSEYNGTPITIKAKMPAHWTDTITAWLWNTGSIGREVVPITENDWYVVTENSNVMNVVFRNGTDWTTLSNQTEDMTFMNSACIQIEQSGSGTKATYEIIDCEIGHIPMDTIYFVNTPEWENVWAYAWDSTTMNINAPWPGEMANKANYQIENYDIYYYVAKKGKHTYCIFSNGDIQTNDLKWTADKYYVVDDWYTWDEAVERIKRLKYPPVTLAGEMNNWDLQASPFVLAEDSLTASVTVELEAKTYEFKIVVDTTWLTNLNTMTRDNCTDWTFEKSGINDNTKITADIAGNYTFIWNYSDSTLSVIYPDPCVDIPELDWQYDIRLSQLTAGWYKLYVGDIHANQSAFTIQFINDLACPATMNRAYYANCEDSEAIIEGSVRYELGETIQTMSYADFADIVAPHVDYLYLNIKNIVEDCPPPCYDTYTEFEETACDSYEWNGHTYTESGDYTYTTTTDQGCEHVEVLHLTISQTLTIEETITTCDFYEWNGQTYTQSGEYTYNTVAANGCDSIVTLHLTINQTQHAEESVTACDSYTWNGQTYATTGAYTYTTTAANGCDSIVTLHLTIHQTQYAEEYITACDSYEWNGQTYTQSGTYTYSTTTISGCDSIVTLYLTINNSVVGETEYATICYGETYTWNGQTYSTTGEYSITLSNALGCDSVATLLLTILPEAVTLEEFVTLNEEELPYIWRGQSYDHAGVYTISEPFANYPYCDSVIYVLNLTTEAPNKCGDNLYWHYSNNTLSITGSGAMYDNPDLLSYRNEPWYPARVNNIVLSNAITHIGNVAFADCANLTNIDIPSSVTSIGDGAFSWTGLQSVTIPASVTELGEQVFETCNNLHTILYEGTPSSISNQTIHPFIGCVHLDTIIAPAELWHCTSADPVLENRYGVPHKARYIEVTNGELTKQAMKYIAKNSGTVEVLDLSAATNSTLPLGALLNNYRLSTLYLPEQIEVIPEMLAEGCYSLTEILIPATVTEIGNYAFAGCTNVWRMMVEAVLPPKAYDKTFDGIDRSISLIVPAGSEDLYRQAEYWREFFIEHTDSPSPISNCQKLLHEDHILILREGKVYTTMGQLITIEK